jgi:hypothetical protein
LHIFLIIRYISFKNKRTYLANSDNKILILNLPKLQKALTLLSNKRSPNFPTNEQKNLLSKLRFIPTYTVVNKNNEIITASPRDYKTSYSLKWLREKSNELFFWSHDEGSVSINLFFIFLSCRHF